MDGGYLSRFVYLFGIGLIDASPFFPIQGTAKWARMILDWCSVGWAPTRPMTSLKYSSVSITRAALGSY